MALVCPKCKCTFEHRTSCPECNVQLVMSARPARSLSVTESRSGWQQTPWGRIFIGLLLAQGLYYGLRQLFLAGMTLDGDPGKESDWAILLQLLIAQGLQLLTVFAAGMLVGAGQRQSMIFGTLMGIWNGVLCLLLYPGHGANVTFVGIYGQPLLQAAFGGLGGWFGSFVWRPIAIQKSDSDKPAPKQKRPVAGRNRFAGPITWSRVVAGSAVAIGGTIWADVIFGYIQQAGRRELSLHRQLHAQIVTWEIMVLAVVAGAAFAGANTKSGLKQGLLVGILTAIILTGFRFAQYEMSWIMLALSLIGPILLGMAGGGFGGQLLPPIIKRRRQSLFDPV